MLTLFMLLALAAFIGSPVFIAFLVVRLTESEHVSDTNRIACADQAVTTVTPGSSDSDDCSLKTKEVTEGPLGCAHRRTSIAVSFLLAMLSTGIWAHVLFQPYAKEFFNAHTILRPIYIFGGAFVFGAFPIAFSLSRFVKYLNELSASGKLRNPVMTVQICLLFFASCVVCVVFLARY